MHNEAHKTRFWDSAVSLSNNIWSTLADLVQIPKEIYVFHQTTNHQPNVQPHLVIVYSFICLNIGLYTQEKHWKYTTKNTNCSIFY